MALPDSDCLADLRILDPDLLYLFLAGPGEGEGIAVAFPGRGWMLVDGCQTVNQSSPKYPLEEIYARYRRPSDQIELMVLTHPHRDHTHGFAELLETLGPARAGVLGVDDPRWLLAEEASAHQKAAAKESPLKAAHRRAHAVLRGIETFASRGEIVGLVDGKTAFERSDLSIHVRAPDEALVREKVQGEGAAAFLGDGANCFSLVLEIVYGHSTLVLGGDLPRTAKGSLVPTGWDLVLHRHPQLVYHDGLKIPHHGSAEALHRDLVGSMQKDRAWCVAPYNSSSLPKLGDSGGMRAALAGQSPIMLTALPVPFTHQKQDIVTMARDEVDSLTNTLKRGPVPGSFLHRTSRPLDPLDPIWAVAFDSEGHIRGRWRGRCALDVTP